MSDTQPAKAGESALPPELQLPAPVVDAPEPMPEPALAQTEADNYQRTFGE